MMTVTHSSTIALELETPEHVFLLRDVVSGTHLFTCGTGGRFGLSSFLNEEDAEIAIQRVIEGAWLARLALLEAEQVTFDQALSLAASKATVDGVWVLDSRFGEIHWQWVR